MELDDDAPGNRPARLGTWLACTTAALAPSGGCGTLAARMDLYDRLTDLYNDLGAFEPTHNPPWQVGQIFNALLGEVKKTSGDDPVVGTIEPARKTAQGNTIPNCGALRAAISQLRAMVRPESGPMIA
jgi:hypothetical protein